MIRHVSVIAKLVIGVVAAMTATAAALAVSGVDLPGDASDKAVAAVQRAGESPEGEGTEAEEGPEAQIENGTGPHEDASPVAHAVWEVISTWQGERGCEFGMAVREAAGGAGPENDPCANGENGNNGENGELTAEEARAAGQEHAEQGRQTGQEQSEQGRQAGEEGEQGSQAGQQGSETGQGRSEQGRQTGQEHAEQGPANRP